MKPDRSTFKSRFPEQKLHLWGILLSGAVLILGMFFWYFFFVREPSGEPFEGFPDPVHFYCGDGDFILGKVTLEELLDRGVNLDISSAEKALELNGGGSNAFRLKIEGDNWVYFWVKNRTTQMMPVLSCPVVEISIRIAESGIEEYIQFDFPFPNSRERILEGAGKPDYINTRDAREEWKYMGYHTGAEYEIVFRRGKMYEFTVNDDR